MQRKFTTDTENTEDGENNHNDTTAQRRRVVVVDPLLALVSMNCGEIFFATCKEFERK